VVEAARLLADLIGESAAGVRTAEREMARATRDLERALDRPPESLVEDAEVDDYLVDLFPDPERPGRTFVRPGTVYPPAAVETFRDLGVDVGAYTTPAAFEMPFDDGALALRTADEALSAGASVPFDATAVAADLQLPVLTDRVVDRIRRTAAFELGCDRRDALRGLLARGVPSAVAETMDVDLKVAFDEDLAVTVPNYREADVGLRPEAIGTVRTHLRFEREG
jgi:hypothetical protein